MSQENSPAARSATSTERPKRHVLRICHPRRKLNERTRVSIKEIFYVHHPQRRHVALSFLYAVREKS
nr:MAG TPA_asm: hypothetical protein [Caudoviricetes sp.]